MSKVIDQYISEGKIDKAIDACQDEGMLSFAELLRHATNNTEVQIDKAITACQDKGNLSLEEFIKHAANNTEVCDSDTESSTDSDDEVIEVPITSSLILPEKKVEKKIRVMLYCNWTSSKALCDIWNKMSKGNYTWNNIQIVWEEPADYYCVINCPPINVFPPLDKTILFHMEPNMDKNPKEWGDWSDPPPSRFKFVGKHSKHFNNNEWHLSKTWKELCEEKIVKDEKLNDVVSAVLSDKYRDPGHIKRIDFAQFLDKKGFPLHVYGSDKYGWKNYKGSPPYHAKDEAMFPYKYTFNVENHNNRGYYTEKLIDGILAESLVFYHGCPNIRDYIDEEAFVWLELVDFEKDYELIKKAIAENWWEKRLPAIKREKYRILNEKQFFPRLEKILS